MSSFVPGLVFVLLFIPSEAWVSTAGANFLRSVVKLSEAETTLVISEADNIFARHSRAFGHLAVRAASVFIPEHGAFSNFSNYSLSLPSEKAGAYDVKVLVPTFYNRSECVTQSITSLVEVNTTVRQCRSLVTDDGSVIDECNDEVVLVNVTETENVEVCVDDGFTHSAPNVAVPFSLVLQLESTCFRKWELAVQYGKSAPHTLSLLCADVCFQGPGCGDFTPPVKGFAPLVMKAVREFLTAFPSLDNKESIESAAKKVLNVVPLSTEVSSTVDLWPALWDAAGYIFKYEWTMWCVGASIMDMQLMFVIPVWMLGSILICEPSMLSFVCGLLAIIVASYPGPLEVKRWGPISAASLMMSLCMTTVRGGPIASLSQVVFLGIAVVTAYQGVQKQRFITVSDALCFLCYAYVFFVVEDSKYNELKDGARGIQPSGLTMFVIRSMSGLQHNGVLFGGFLEDFAPVYHFVDTLFPALKISSNIVGWAVILFASRITLYLGFRSGVFYTLMYDQTRPIQKSLQHSLYAYLTGFGKDTLLCLYNFEASIRWVVTFLIMTYMLVQEILYAREVAFVRIIGLLVGLVYEPEDYSHTRKYLHSTIGFEGGYENRGSSQDIDIERIRSALSAVGTIACQGYESLGSMWRHAQTGPTYLYTTRHCIGAKDEEVSFLPIGATAPIILCSSDFDVVGEGTDPVIRAEIPFSNAPVCELPTHDKSGLAYLICKEQAVQAVPKPITSATEAGVLRVRSNLRPSESGAPLIGFRSKGPPVLLGTVSYGDKDLNGVSSIPKKIGKKVPKLKDVPIPNGVTHQRLSEYNAMRHNNGNDPPREAIDITALARAIVDHLPPGFDVQNVSSNVISGVGKLIEGAKKLRGPKVPKPLKVEAPLAEALASLNAYAKDPRSPNNVRSALPEGSQKLYDSHRVTVVAPDGSKVAVRKGGTWSYE